MRPNGVSVDSSSGGECAKPSAPTLSLLEHHYGSEIGCDVVFLVGPTNDPRSLRIPAHSHILKTSTPVFDAMFSPSFFNQEGEVENKLGIESTATLHQIPVPDLDGKAFDNLMKHIYDIPLVLQSPETTIETLKASHKYQCPGLVRKCVTHLISLISVENVLLITANVALLCGDFENLENLHRESTIISSNNSGNCKSKRKSGDGNCITFPQLEQRLSEPTPELNIELDCAWLVYNCLDFIDKNASAVLQSEEIEDLDYPTIHHIMSRDTLNVEEGLVFTSVARWADKECKRRHLPLTQISKREVLQDLLYVPRYLRMNPSDFLAGPAQSNLLSKEEIETLTHIIQIGPDTFLTSNIVPNQSPNASPFKRIQSLGIPASKSLRIHLGYMLRPRKVPGEQQTNGQKGGNGCRDRNGGSSSNDGNWKWVARLRKIRYCLLCGEGGATTGSRCVTAVATPTSPLASPVRRSYSTINNDLNDQPLSNSNSSYYDWDRGREQPPYKPGFVERAVVIFACLFD